MSKSIIILSGVPPDHASAKVVMDFYNGFRRKNYNCRIISKGSKTYEDPGIFLLPNSSNFLIERIKNKIKRIFKIYNTKYYMLSVNNFKKKLNIYKYIKYKPDFILYLFTHNFVNEEELYLINKETGAKIFHIAVDMAPLTGGCHYAWDCKGYINDCGKCPGIFSNDPNDLTYNNLLFKKKYTKLGKIEPIAVSSSLRKQFNESSVYKHKKIHFSLLPTDEKIFNTRSINDCRIKFNIKSNKKVILIGAVNTQEMRKGYAELLKILQLLYKSEDIINDDILLLVCGKYNSNINSALSFNSINVGYLTYDDLAMAYNASDVYFCTSIEDSGPTMINQSLMCGTPVVSFDMGVAKDLIINDKNGYVANLNDIEDYVNGAIKLINNRDHYNNNTRDWCAKDAANKTSSESVINHYINNILC